MFFKKSDPGDPKSLKDLIHQRFCGVTGGVTGVTKAKIGSLIVR